MLRIAKISRGRSIRLRRMKENIENWTESNSTFQHQLLLEKWLFCITYTVIPYIQLDPINPLGKYMGKKNHHIKQKTKPRKERRTKKKWVHPKEREAETNSLTFLFVQFIRHLAKPMEATPRFLFCKRNAVNYRLLSLKIARIKI